MVEGRPQSMSSGRVIPDRLLETHLARVLFSAERRRQTGVLTVDEGAVQTRLHVVDGRVVFAEAGTVAETLGRVLLKAGVIDRDEYLLILEAMARPSDRDEVLRFGEVAISLGMIEPAQLSDALALQVKSKLARCLLLDHAVWIWVDDESPRRTTPYPTPLEPTLLEALRSDAELRWLDRLTPHAASTARLKDRPDEIARRFVLRAQELRLLSKLEGQPLGHALASSPLEGEEAAALIVALLLADLVELRAPEQRARPEPTAEAPSREHRAREAASRLRDEMMRRRGPAPAPVTQRDRVDAERVFERGRKLLAQGAVDAARQAFEEAAELLPEAADYALYWRWARWLAESDALRRSVYEQDLRDCVLAALQQDRTLAFAHHVQGRLLLLSGDERGAERAFAIAARLDPDDVENQRYVRLLRARR